MTCICVLTAFRPSFPHLETLKKILENSTLSRYVKKKKKKKKNPDRPTQFFYFGRVRGNITFFFFWPNTRADTNHHLQKNRSAFIILLLRTRRGLALYKVYKVNFCVVYKGIKLFYLHTFEDFSYFTFKTLTNFVLQLATEKSIVFSIN